MQSNGLPTKGKASRLIALWTVTRGSVAYLRSKSMSRHGSMIVRETPANPRSTSALSPLCDPISQKERQCFFRANGMVNRRTNSGKVSILRPNLDGFAQNLQPDDRPVVLLCLF